jgi:hypothetical protein
MPKRAKSEVFSLIVTVCPQQRAQYFGAHLSGHKPIKERNASIIENLNVDIIRIITTH